MNAVETAPLVEAGRSVADYWLDIEGAAATRMILAREPGTKVLILSWFHGPREIESALGSGSAGFLPKSLSVSHIADAIERANDGESPVFAEDLNKLVRKIETRISRLTPSLLATGH